jgi:hypothetical protein
MCGDWLKRVETSSLPSPSDLIRGPMHTDLRRCSWMARSSRAMTEKERDVARRPQALR